MELQNCTVYLWDDSPFYLQIFLFVLKVKLKKNYYYHPVLMHRGRIAGSFFFIGMH